MKSGEKSMNVITQARLPLLKHFYNWSANEIACREVFSVGFKGWEGITTLSQMQPITVHMMFKLGVMPPAEVL